MVLEENRDRLTMKALILAAGFGTRLEKSLEGLEQYSHLRGLSKALVPIAGKPLIEYWVKQIRACSDIFDDVYIVANAVNFSQFEKWAVEHDFPLQNIYNNGVLTNEKRNGSIGDLALSVQRFQINDDLFVVTGDLLFYPDFSLEKAVSLFKQCGADMVTTYHVNDDWVSRTGILEIDKNGYVQSFLEKPQPSQTTSRQGCPTFYLYRRETLPLFARFLEQKKQSSIEERDSPGRFIPWLLQHQKVYAYPVSGRFDVGSVQDYQQADTFFREFRGFKS